MYKYKAAYIGGTEHVFGVYQDADNSHELYSTPQLWVIITDHLFYHQVDQQVLLNGGKCQINNAFYL